MQGGRAKGVVAVAIGLVLVIVVPSRGRAGDGEACREQAAVAERTAGVPEGLLLAIGKRESGRLDVQSGEVLPWPWAVNRDGEGHIFASREAAIAYVAAAQLQGSRSIDVGCFQINLKYHPIAFASLDEAFDPAKNAAYAARFLTILHDREGSWETAVADYHSGTPLLGVPYREAVFATWRGGADVAARFRSVLGPERVVMGIRIWTAGAASFYPTAAMGAAAAVARPGLPRVITPAGPVASGPAGQRRFGIRVIAGREGAGRE